MPKLKATRIELSAGGVVYRNGPGGAPEVLLILDGYGNWGWPKGHIEPGESPEQAAIRECREETGLTRLTLVAPVGTTDWYFRAGNVLVHKFCDYFLLEADPAEEAKPQRAEGIQDCFWMDPKAAASRVTYSNARQVLESALELRPGVE